MTRATPGADEAAKGPEVTPSEPAPSPASAAVPSGPAAPGGGSPGADEAATHAGSPTPDPAAPNAARRPRVRGRGWLADLAVAVGLAAAAGWLTHGLWSDPATRVLSLNVTDQALNEWFLARSARIYVGELQLVTYALNAPEGVNLLGNASLILLGAVLGPITLAYGAPVSFAVALGANLAATGFGWYLLLHRTMRLHRFAAIVAAAFTAFAPGMISQNNAHLHITAQWLVPPIVWCVHRLAGAADLAPQPRRRRVRSTAALLAALVTAQLFLGEEVLFLTAVTLALFCLAYAAAAPARARRLVPAFAAGIALAAGLSVVPLAYPLWVQFAGPQHVLNIPFSAATFSADLAAFPAISPMSLAGHPDNARLAAGPAEYNNFFGIPLLLVLTAVVLWLRRRPVAVAAASAAGAMAVLSLGPYLIVDGVRTGFKTPFYMIDSWPVVSGALPTRYALALIPLVALLLALAVDTALRDNERLRLLVPVAVIAALLPIAPRPLPTQHRPPVPRFFTEGHWRDCVRPGGVLVPAPLPDALDPDPMRWAAAADGEFGLPQGFFIGPYAGRGQASVGLVDLRPTSALLDEVDRTGLAPTLTDDQRAAARADVAYWRASCVVLADRRNAAALRVTLDGLFGPGEDVADVRVWRVG